MNVLDNFYNIQKVVNSLSKNTKIIAVSKNFNIEKIDPLIQSGHKDFGENKVQEATLKWTNILKKNKDINLHLLGHLQSNKVSEAVNIFHYIHSLDSKKLANKFMQEEKKINKKLKYFIQVNVGEEQQKSGIHVKESFDFINLCKNELNLDILGLMCIPPINKDPGYYFSQLKELALSNKLLHLSMGMTHDYVEAIHHGATYIRIGTGIFGERI
jgi:pyridoxal phosphate enzyme (YggS family)